MRIIITKRFEKEYLKQLNKYFSKLDLVNSIKSKKHSFISLHDPFFKFKNKLNLVDFRWVLVMFKNNDIIPIMIYLKKDKNNWENISRQNHKQKIENEFEFTKFELEKWNFEIF